MPADVQSRQTATACGAVDLAVRATGIGCWKRYVNRTELTGLAGAAHLRIGAYGNTSDVTDPILNRRGLPRIGLGSGGGAPLVHKGQSGWYVMGDVVPTRIAGDPKRPVTSFGGVIGATADYVPFKGQAIAGVIVTGPFDARGISWRSGCGFRSMAQRCSVCPRSARSSRRWRLPHVRTRVGMAMVRRKPLSSIACRRSMRQQAWRMLELRKTSRQSHRRPPGYVVLDDRSTPKQDGNRYAGTMKKLEIDLEMLRLAR